jgi:CRISPR-associated endonuclease/helicase Cas3
MSETTRYFAHTCDGHPEPDDRWQPLALHLREVARMARLFAEGARPAHETEAQQSAEEERVFAASAYCAGLLHDLGKYQVGFQEYLRFCARGLPHVKVPHAPLGAAKGIGKLGMAHGFVPAGHHQGIPNQETLRRYSREWSEKAESLWSTAAEDCAELQMLGSLKLPDSIAKEPLRADVFIRMLFSCLVDADWCDTNAWKNGGYPFQYDPKPLAPNHKFEALKHHVGAKPKAGEINSLREGVFQNCATAAERSPGFFTLTVPTGGGKTLASLAFALKHCTTHEQSGGARRIIYVIPYLNILEQTANEFYEALSVAPGDGTILEHHSLAYQDRPEPKRRPSDTEKDGAEPESPMARRMEENWDAPIILTTSVQFFESLFSNRPAAARKLHHIARSVVIFDECQTFPEGLYGPTLNMLNELVDHWGVTFLFCTATQPAVREGPAMRQGIPEEKLREIMTDPPPSELFPAMHRLRPGDACPRVRVTWPTSKEHLTSWGELAEQMRERRQALAIVNIKSHARQLFEALGGRVGTECPEELFYLSTLMCAEHRRHVLKEIKQRLTPSVEINKRPHCFVASTQLVEAGVDIDFSAVFRAFGPLDAIAQAAGRCNREGKLTNESGELDAGRVVVFRPAMDSAAKKEYPTTEYERGADVTQELLNEAILSGFAGPQILEPQTYDRYFSTLLSRLDTDAKDIQNLRVKLEFPLVAASYQLIDENTEQVIVPFSPDGIKQNSPVHKLLREARARGYVPLEIRRKLQPYLVNLWPHEFARALRMVLVLEVADGWWEWIGSYDRRCGLMFDIDPLPPI